VAAATKPKWEPGRLVKGEAPGVGRDARGEGHIVVDVKVGFGLVLPVVGANRVGGNLVEVGLGAQLRMRVDVAEQPLAGSLPLCGRAGVLVDGLAVNGDEAPPQDARAVGGVSGRPVGGRDEGRKRGTGLGSRLRGVLAKDGAGRLGAGG